MTLNVRGSYYNMVDEFYNPSLELGEAGLAGYWPTPWYSSLYNSGYVYYPALDVTTGTGTATTNRLGRQGREWYQHPDAWTASARMNYYMGGHNMKWGGEMRSYFGEAARFEPINLVFNSALTANSSDTPDVTNSGNQWATFLLGALDYADLGPPRAAAGARSQELRRLLPGRLERERSADPQCRVALGIRAGRDRSAEPHLAAARSHVADSRNAGHAAADSGAGVAVDGIEGLRLQLQRRMDLRERKQSLRVEHVGAEPHAAPRRRLPAR